MTSALEDTTTSPIASVSGLTHRTTVTCRTLQTATATRPALRTACAMERVDSVCARRDSLEDIVTSATSTSTDIPTANVSLTYWTNL